METTFFRLTHFGMRSKDYKQLLKFKKPTNLHDKVDISDILAINGPMPALWALRTVKDRSVVPLIIKDLFENIKPTAKKYGLDVEGYEAALLSKNKKKVFELMQISYSVNPRNIGLKACLHFMVEALNVMPIAKTFTGTKLLIELASYSTNAVAWAKYPGNSKEQKRKRIKEIEVQKENLAQILIKYL